jgi:hypothetical protein
LFASWMCKTRFHLCRLHFPACGIQALRRLPPLRLGHQYVHTVTRRDGGPPPLVLAVLKMIFNLCLGPPSPGGSRGRVRTTIFLRESEVLGRFRPESGEQILFVILILVLSAAELCARRWPKRSGTWLPKCASGAQPIAAEHGPSRPLLVGVHSNGKGADTETA